MPRFDMTTSSLVGPLIPRSTTIRIFLFNFGILHASIMLKKKKKSIMLQYTPVVTNRDTVTETPKLPLRLMLFYADAS